MCHGRRLLWKFSKKHGVRQKVSPTDVGMVQHRCGINPFNMKFKKRSFRPAGGAWYKGKWLTAEAPNGARKINLGRDPALSILSWDQTRLKVLSWNLGGLHSALYDKLMLWLSHTDYDMLLVSKRL